MDDIFTADIAITAQKLRLDRLFIVQFKYHSFPPLDNRESIPEVSVEIVYNWSLLDEKLPKIYQLSESFFSVYSWKKAPEYIQINNKKQLEKIKLHQDKIFNFNNTESILILPLLSSKNILYNTPLVMGLLVMENYKPRRWQPGEVETGKWMAKQITTAIVNQQTLKKIQSLVDEKTNQLRVSLDVQAKLGQRMRNYIKELKRLNTIKDEFIASLSDALKTPLSNMKMGIKMLKLKNKNEGDNRYLDILEDECEKEINLVSNLLALQALESHQLTLEAKKIYLKPLLDDLYNSFSQELHYQHIDLVIESQLDSLYTDLNSLTFILKELLTNASKFSTPHSNITLQIYAQQSDNIIEITNYGCAIEKQEQNQIFQPFYQGKCVANVTNSGTGLGLALVKSLVQNLNGNVTVSSTFKARSNNYFNTFIVTFPIVSE